MWFDHATLLSDVPAAAPLAAVCKAPEWCGVNLYERDDRTEEDRRKTRAFLDPANESYGFTARHEDKIRCSEPCVPPLAAQPAETSTGICHNLTGVPGQHTACFSKGGCKYQPTSPRAPDEWCKACGCGNDGLGYAHLESCSKAKPAPQPAPAKDDFWFTDNEGKRRGPFSTGLEADSAGVDYRNWMAAQTGTPYTGPERLGRPKLPHAAGMHDDDLIGGAR
jgi:hypothetical protein